MYCRGRGRYKMLFKILKTFLKDSVKQIGLGLKKEIDEGLVEVRETLIKKFSGLDNAVLAQAIINMLKNVLLGAWKRLLAKYSSKKELGFFQTLLISTISPMVIKEINETDKYQSLLEEFLSKQVTENRISKAIEWVDSQSDRLIDKVFKL